MYSDSNDVDPECPKDAPYSFSFRVAKIKGDKKLKFRHYKFATETRADREKWLTAFNMLMEFRRML